MSQLQSHSALPELRPELQFKPGIRELDGSKSWLIFDPLRHEYFQINTKNLKILGLWGGATAGEIVERLYEYSVTLDDICLLYTSQSPRDLSTSRMPSSA